MTQAAVVDMDKTEAKGGRERRERREKVLRVG